MIVSSEEQRASAIHVHVSKSPPKSRLPCNIGQNSMCCTKIYFFLRYMTILENCHSLPQYQMLVIHKCVCVCIIFFLNSKPLFPNTSNWTINSHSSISHSPQTGRSWRSETRCHRSFFSSHPPFLSWLQSLGAPVPHSSEAVFPSLPVSSASPLIWVLSHSVTDLFQIPLLLLQFPFSQAAILLPATRINLLKYSYYLVILYVTSLLDSCCHKVETSP